MAECIFCKIIKGKAPCRKVAENTKALAFDSIAPVAEHHVLIVPKEHISTFKDLEEHHKDSLMGMVKLAQEVIEKRKISGGYKLSLNGGKYQSVSHIHWHLLGGELEDKEDILNNT